jgi:hypothetical protein
MSGSFDNVCPSLIFIAGTADTWGIVSHLKSFCGFTSMMPSALKSFSGLFYLSKKKKILIEFVLNTGYIYIYQRSCPKCSISV